MLAVREPIGKFIALANLEKGMISAKPVERDIAELVDLLTVRIQNKSVQETATDLSKRVFDLRFSLLNYLTENGKNLNDYQQSVSEHIAVNLQLAPYSKLAATTSEVLLTFQEILTPLINNLPADFSPLQTGKPQYSTFALLALHPSPQIRYVKKWLDASLELEIGLILAELILTGQVKLSKKKIETELTEFLYATVKRFGAYSIFTGFWTPESESDMTNGMQILAATLDFEHGSYYKTTKDGLFELINN